MSKEDQFVVPFALPEVCAPTAAATTTSPERAQALAAAWAALDREAPRLAAWIAGRADEASRTTSSGHDDGGDQMPSVASCSHPGDGPGPNWLTPSDVATWLKISVKTLGRRMARLPAGLPGEPVNVGTARKRRLRWNPDTFDQWVEAFNKHFEEAGRKKGRGGRARRGGGRSRDVDPDSLVAYARSLTKE